MKKLKKLKLKSNIGEINSAEDLQRELRGARIRIQEKEAALRNRVRQVPGELFYSSIDSIIPSMLTGKVSSFALNAGRGLINNFFVRKAVTAGSFKLLSYVKPSGVVKKGGRGLAAIFKKKK